MKNPTLDAVIEKIESCLKAGNDHQVRQAIQAWAVRLRQTQQSLASDKYAIIDAKPEDKRK